MENLPFASAILKIIQFVPFITNALLYLNIVFYIGLSVYGVMKGRKGIIWFVPYLYNFVDKYIHRKKATKNTDKKLNP